MNEQRKEKKRPPLAHDARVADIARAHSDAMASGRIPPGHEGFDARWTQVTTLLGAREAAENIAIIPHDAKAPAQMAVETWMKSKLHRDNLLDDYRFSGIGIAKASDGKLFMTQIFVGAPASDVQPQTRRGTTRHAWSICTRVFPIHAAGASLPARADLSV